MKINNKIESSFGPSGSWTGIFMFVAGIAMIYFSFVGWIMAIPGALIGFTFESTIIDTDKRRVKHVNNLFGLIPVGKWIKLEPGMTIGIKKRRRGYRTITRGHSLETHISDIRIFLYSFDKSPIIPLKKFDSIDIAERELETLGNQLELAIL